MIAYIWFLIGSFAGLYFQCRLDSLWLKWYGEKYGVTWDRLLAQLVLTIGGPISFLPAYVLPLFGEPK